MSTNTLTVIIVVILAVLFIGVTWLAIYFKKHKIDATAVVKDIGTGITYAQSIATAVSPFLPKVADSTITLLLNLASEATTRAEATFKAALSADAGATDTRTAEAKSLITSGLALKGITATADINKLIDAVMPLLVLALPKTHTATATTTAATTGTTTATTATTGATTTTAA